MKKNPLYVVTNKGKVVETASSLIDAWVKKWGLAPLVSALEEIWRFLLEQARTFVWIQILEKWLEQIIQKLSFLFPSSSQRVSE